jgi:hypothetical protein
MRDFPPSQADKGAGLGDATISSAGDAVGSGTLTPPSISLPKGGGALRGIGEKFVANRPWPVRLDPFSISRAGFEVRTYRLCQCVLMFHHIPDLPTGEKGYDGLVRSTSFTYLYETDPAHAKNPVYSRLVLVTQSGYQRQDDGSYLRKSLPPLELEYSDPVLHDVVKQVTAESLENMPAGLDGVACQWTDLHGECIPGVLTEQAGAWYYKRNLSPINKRRENGTVCTEAKFAPVEVVADKHNLPGWRGAAHGSGRGGFVGRPSGDAEAPGSSPATAGHPANQPVPPGFAGSATDAMIRERRQASTASDAASPWWLAAKCDTPRDHAGRDDRGADDGLARLY